MEFVASFPHLVRSIALLAPVGLLRTMPGVYEDLRQAARNGTDDSELKKMLAGVLGVDEKVNTENEADANAVALKRWQYEHHQGHPTSFVSTLVNGPLQNQHEVWREACEGLKGKQGTRQGKEKLVVICGAEDNVVPAEHVKEDLDEMMGNDHYVFAKVPGDHGFLMDDGACKKVVDMLMAEWEL